LCCCGSLLGCYVWRLAGCFCDVAGLRAGLQQLHGRGHMLSFAYNTWALLESTIPWTYTNSGLPNFENFLAGLRPVKKRGRRQGRRAEEKEHECLICWSDDAGLPLRLPCRPDHLVCAHCIIRLHNSGQNQCPFCRLPLYTIHGGAAKLCGFIIACFGAGCPIGPVFIALNCYKEWWYWTIAAIFLTVPVMLSMWYLFTVPRVADVGHLAHWLDEPVGSGVAIFAVLFACWCVWQIWGLDQVTFVDGKLMGAELEVWMGHSFFWES
jgi:hypothetical protein